MAGREGRAEQGGLGGVAGGSPGPGGPQEGWELLPRLPAQHTLSSVHQLPVPSHCAAGPRFLSTLSPLGLKMRREPGSLLTAGGVCREGDASLSLVHSVVGILKIVIPFLNGESCCLLQPLWLGHFLSSIFKSSLVCSLVSAVAFVFPAPSEQSPLLSVLWLWGPAS